LYFLQPSKVILRPQALVKRSHRLWPQREMGGWGGGVRPESLVKGKGKALCLVLCRRLSVVEVWQTRSGLLSCPGLCWVQRRPRLQADSSLSPPEFSAALRVPGLGTLE
jgi:hypothetical protein